MFILRFKICASYLETKAQKHSQPDACQMEAAGNSMFPQLHSRVGSFLSSLSFKLDGIQFSRESGLVIPSPWIKWERNQCGFLSCLNALYSSRNLCPSSCNRTVCVASDLGDTSPSDIELALHAAWMDKQMEAFSL